jgi:hypothetical protein
MSKLIGSVAAPSSREEDLRRAGVIEAGPKPMPAPLSIEDRQYADLQTLYPDLPPDPEAQKRITAYQTAAFERLSDLTKNYYKGWQERHGDAPPQVTRDIWLALANSITSRPAEFFTPEGDWNPRAAETELDNVSRAVCEAAGYSPRPDLDSYVAERNARNPARPSSILTRL